MLMLAEMLVISGLAVEVLMLGGRLEGKCFKHLGKTKIHINLAQRVDLRI